MNDDNTPSIPTDRRPLGFWLRTVDALITREFADAFAGESVTRRDWMLLNALAGDVDTTWLTERLARKGKRLRRLEDLGWAEEQGDGTWTLTDAGREAKERLGAIVDGVRERVSGAVSPEDFATTMASLEAIARQLGWDEGMRMPRTGRRGFGRGRGFGPGRGRGFAPGFGPDFGYGFDPRAAFGYGFGPGFSRDLDDEDDHAPHHGHAHPHHGHGHGHGCHGGHPHAGHGHGHGQRAYERGFDAGFARGRTEG